MDIATKFDKKPNELRKNTNAIYLHLHSVVSPAKDMPVTSPVDFSTTNLKSSSSMYV